MSYTSRPELYDLEYSFKDYAGEVATIERIVRERNAAQGRCSTSPAARASTSTT